MFVSCPPFESFLSSSGPTHGLTQLGLRSDPTGSFVPEATTTLLSFFRPDRSVYTTASVRPLGPCQLTPALAGPVFSYLWNPYPSFPGGFYDFHGRLYLGLGRPHGGFPNFGYMGPSGPPAPYQLLGAQGGRGHQVMIATDNSTVVSYINKQGGTRSHTLLRLVVELFMWLQAQNIVVRARHIPGCLNVIADHLSCPNQPITTEWSLHPEIVSRIFGFWGTPVVDMFPTVSNSRLPTLSLCGSSTVLSLLPRSCVTTGSEIHLGRKVVPSTRMEALLRHYKAAGFSDEVSRLAAAPRRPSTNRMYDDRWLRFTRWAAGQGFDQLNPSSAQIASFLYSLFDPGLSPQTIKGYRTCLGSVLNRTGKAKVVLHRTISDMIASVELQRPRVMPVLPQWDLGIVLEALSKSPYEPLREASLKTVADFEDCFPTGHGISRKT